MLRKHLIMAISRYIHDLKVPFGNHDEFVLYTYKYFGANLIREHLIKYKTPDEEIEAVLEFYINKLDECACANKYMSIQFSAARDSAVDILDLWIRIENHI